MAVCPVIMGRDAGNLDFSAASNYWRCHISDYFPAETLYWFKKTLQDGSILRTVRYAEPTPGLIIWHAWYDPRCFSFLDAQTQEALRIAGLENAPIRRQAEYWAGRSLMMLALGLQTPPGRMLSGAPHLPDGVSGSLSHSSDNILLLLGPEGVYAGADIERRLKPVGLQSVISRVATPVEQCWLHSLTASRQQICATVLFSAKETLFKALCTKTNINPDYMDVEALTPPQHGILSFRLNRNLGSGLGSNQCFKLRYAQMNDFVLTWLCQSSI
ncbi:4'-phosphopantetheinyl transferase superfamily protein [Salmonella enterica]|nr:4'-phosphopantetheinyl transferase superfamily protein [Salmonella enterica]